MLIDKLGVEIIMQILQSRYTNYIEFSSFAWSVVLEVMFLIVTFNLLKLIFMYLSRQILTRMDLLKQS